MFRSQRQTKMTKRMTKTLASSLLLVAMFPSINAADWSQWRGDERRGVAIDSPALTTSLDKEIAPSWSYDLPATPKKPPFYGTPIGASGLVYFHGTVIAANAEAGAKKPPLDDVVVCVKLADGSEVWQQRLAIGTSSKLGAPNAPLLHAGKLYVLAGNGTLRILNAADGSVSKDVDLKMHKGAKGVCSPVLAGDTIVIQDKDLIGVGLDGSERWRIAKHGDKHQSPAVWETDGRHIVLANGSKTVIAVDAKSGDKIFETTPTSGASSLVIHNNQLIRLRDGEAGGLSIADLSLTGLSNEKTVDFVCNGGGHNANTPVVHDGKAYAMGKAEVLCVDLATAATVWTVPGKGDAKHSPILAGSSLITHRSPGLKIFSITDGKEIASGKMKLQGCSSSCLVDGRLLWQDGKKLHCLDLRAK